MDSMKISDCEISVNRILTDQRPLFMSSRSISGRPTVWRRITREDGAGGAMWLPLLPRLGGYARRCRWYRHGQCTRYAAGESHAANSYLCAQKSRVATTLSVMNVVPSCLIRRLGRIHALLRMQFAPFGRVGEVSQRRRGSARAVRGRRNLSSSDIADGVG